MPGFTNGAEKGGEEDEDQISVLDDNPQLDDALILRMTYDLATKFHKPEVIARRYGLSSEAELRNYLRNHPAVVARAQKLHALFESDAASEDRVRMKFLHATEELIIPMAGLVADPHTPLSARIDGFKQIQRGAGLDGLSSAAKTQNQREAGQPFNLTINFAGGRDGLSAVGREIINATTVVDQDLIPPPPAGWREEGEGENDEDNYPEDLQVEGDI